MATKKNTFYRCDACHRNYADRGIAAPQNKYRYKVVCSNCYKKYFGVHPPLPSGAASVLQNKFGAFLPVGGAKIISTNGGGIVTNASSNLINQDGASFGRKS